MQPTSTPFDDEDSPPASRAAEIGERAAAAIDAKRDTVASGIDSAASALHARAERLPGGEKIARGAHNTADALEKAADYVRDQDVKGMLSDVRQGIARHPGAALLAAAAVGFVIARSLARR